MLLVLLHLLDAVEDLLEERVILLQTTELGHGLLGCLGAHDLGELDGLFITLDVLETQRHLHTTQQRRDIISHLCELCSRADEAFLAAELPERSPSYANADVFEMWVGDTGDDGVDVCLLLLVGDAVLILDEVSCLL